MPLLVDLRVHLTWSQMPHLIQALQNPKLSPSSTYPLPLLRDLAIKYCVEYESDENEPNNWEAKMQKSLKKLIVERGDKGTATLKLVRVVDFKLGDELIKKLAKLNSGVEITYAPDPMAHMRPY